MNDLPKVVSGPAHGEAAAIAAEDDALRSAGVDLDAEDDALRAAGVEPPSASPPRGFRETGRTNIVTELPETTFEVDVNDPSRSRTTTAPGRGALVEERQVEREVAGVTAPEDVGFDPRARPGGTDSRRGNPRLLEYLRSRQGPNNVTLGGVEMPTPESAGGFLQSGSVNALFPTAERPEGMAASEPDQRSQAGVLGATSLFGWADELGELGGYDAEQMRASRARSAQQAPGQAALGGVAESIPLMAIPGGQQTALGRVGAAMLTGTGLGLARGAGESEAEDPLGVLEDATEQGVIEGGTAGVFSGAGEAVSPLVRRLGRFATSTGDEAARGAVQSRLEASGVWGGRAMRAADEMPGGSEALASDMRRLGIGHGVGEPARVARARATGEPARRTALPRSTRTPDDALQVMDEAGERMRSVLDEMDEAASGRNAALLEGTREQAMRGMVDVSRVADDMEAIAREYEMLPVGGPQIAASLRTQIVEPMRAMGVVRFSDAHRQRRLIDGMIRGWAADPNLATAAGRLQTARRGLSSAMDEAAARLSPELQARWRQANRDYSVGAFADEYGQGASRQSTMGGMGGAMATGVELATAGNPIAAIPASIANRAAAQETRRVMPGLQTRALEGLAPRLRALGPRAEGWARALEAAQQRGGTSLAVTHALLQRRYPEYRQAVEEMDENDVGGVGR